jgi:membrane protease YdiL (CAAX protease family)
VLFFLQNIDHLTKRIAFYRQKPPSSNNHKYERQQERLSRVSSNLVFPAITDLTTFIIIIAVGFPLVYLFSKALRLNPKRIEPTEKSKEAVRSLLIFVVIFIITFAILYYYQNVWVRPTLTEDLIYVLRDAGWMIVILLPVIAILKLTRQNFGSIGITRENISKNISLGVLLSAVFITIFAFLGSRLGGTSFVGLSVPIIYSLISLAIIGFGEEIVFRGYVQTRLTASKGAIWGLLFTSVLYAIFQFPVGYFCFGGDIQSGLFYALWRLSAGLVFGYVFHKSQSIIPSSILHTLLVWGALLWGLYF